jgi:hypothetical protein
MTSEFEKKCALRTTGKICMLAGMVKHVISVSQTAISILKILSEDKAPAKGYSKTLRVLGEAKA